MAKAFAKQFYNSKAWQRCRDSYIAGRVAIDGGLCEHCRKSPGYIVHHTVLLTPGNIDDPEISLNHERLEYVCKSCHDEEHYRDMNGEERRIYFDEEGQPIPPVEKGGV